MRHGMPHRRLGTHYVEIDEDELLAWLRARILANPTNRVRLGLVEPKSNESREIA
jgi:hypothetical protein